MNSGLSTNGQSYTVVFPAAGNYKLLCLLHANMTAAVHVLDPSQLLPHDQAFYDNEAASDVIYCRSRSRRVITRDAPCIRMRSQPATARSRQRREDRKPHRLCVS